MLRTISARRLALAVLGAALLPFGPGFAAAQPTHQHLDGTAAKGNAPTAVAYASELLTNEIPGATLKAVPVKSPDGDTADDTPGAHRLIVTPRRLIDADQGSDTNNLYFRVTLGGGMTFSAAQTGTDNWGSGNFLNNALIGGAGTYDTQIYAGGGIGETFAVFKANGNLALNGAPIDESSAGPPDAQNSPTPLDLNGDGDTDDQVALRNSLWFVADDKLAVPAGGEADYTATISAHRTADDAVADRNPTGTVAGSAVIVKVEEGIAASVCAAGSTGCGARNKVVAHVGSTPKPFLWFRIGGKEQSNATLGVASAMAKPDAGLIHPKDGSEVSDTDLIEDGSLTIEVTGDFSIGGFNLGAGWACDSPGTADKPFDGNLAPAKDEPANQATRSALDAGAYSLCIQAYAAGPNATPIPATMYTGTITLGTGSTAIELAAGTIGDIRRNGTTVKLTHLTISPEYDQRLIIVNDSAANAVYSIGDFSAEDGVTVTARAMAGGEIAAGEKLVLAVEDIVGIAAPSGGEPRTAATLSINADPGDVQVATSQVNLRDGSTDTVLYAAKGGVEVN